MDLGSLQIYRLDVQRSKGGEAEHHSQFEISRPCW
jgi:hypothetical protein